MMTSTTTPEKRTTLVAANRHPDGPLSLSTPRHHEHSSKGGMLTPVMHPISYL